MNFVAEKEETEPGMVVLWLTRVTWQPVTKFVPDILIGSELVFIPGSRSDRSKFRCRIFNGEHIHKGHVRTISIPDTQVVRPDREANQW